MISKRIKSERKRLNLNQTEFAKACGVGLRSQSNYENGERSPDSDYLQKAHELGVDINYLIVGEPAKSNLTKQEMFLLQEFRRLTAEQKEIALRFFIGGLAGLQGKTVINSFNGTIFNSFNGS